MFVGRGEGVGGKYSCLFVGERVSEVNVHVCREGRACQM